MNKLQKLKQENEDISKLIEKNADDRGCKRVIDGIIDPEKYLKAKHKVLWILKEANSEQDSWSYIENFKRKDWLQEHGRRNPTLRKVIYTTYGVLKDSEWSDIPWANEEAAFTPLQEIGLINIKKMPGGNVAIDNSIQAAYDKDVELLKRQIKAYDADIIIFGGSFRYFYKSDFEGLDSATKEKTELGNHYYNTGKKLYINSWHPSATNNTDKNYVMDIVQIVKKWEKE